MTSYTPSQRIDIPAAESLFPALKKGFDKAGLKSIKDLVDRGPIYVSKATGLDFEDAEQLCNSAASKLENQRFVSKPFQTAAEFDENRKKNLQWISTGAKRVDSIFGGNGIETGAVTEFYGAAGTGKTQICYSLSVMVQQDESKGGLSGKALFIDTENTFSSERIRSIAKARGLDSSNVLKNIFVATAENTLEQESTIERFESNITCYTSIKLVIVDSVLRNYRAEFPGRSMLSERQQKLNIFMHQLLRVAATHRIAVVVTNQVQTCPDELYNIHPQPIGGNVMAHASTYRVYLGPSGYNRIARLVDSPYHPENEVRFRITERGIDDIPDRL